jgi:hypothetical protein
MMTSLKKPLVQFVCKTTDLNLSQMYQHTSAPLLYDIVSVSFQPGAVQRKKTQSTFCVIVQFWLLSDTHISVPVCWTQGILRH